MRKCVLNSIFFLLIFLVEGLGQQTNPFEVDTTSTETVSDILPKSDKDNAQNRLTNPFDVDHTLINKAEVSKVKTIEKPIEDKVSPTHKDTFREKPTQVGSFLFWLFAISLLILAVVINLRRKTFINLYRSIFNDNYLNLMHREESGGGSVFFMLLYIIFLINASIFCYLSIRHLHYLSGIPYYVNIFFFLLAIYIIRHICMNAIAFIFPFKKASKQFNFTIIVFNSMLGIALFPINVFYAYSPLTTIMFFIGLLVIVFFYSIRQLRGLFLVFRIPGLNLFHFFVYLCTCEIAPLLIILKLVTIYNSSI